MNVVVLGAYGMAGHVISKYLKLQGHTVTDITRETVDFENKSNIDSIDFSNADFVINCVGLLVQESIDRPDRAITLNSWLPHYIEHLLSKTKTRLVHLSTDCVFDGVKGNYTEDDIPNETNMYGKSKHLGEINNSKDVTFRMSIIGPELKENGTGLMHWFLNKSPVEVDGRDNALWNGITTLQLAKCIVQHMETPTSGIKHVVNESSVSKFTLLELINKIFAAKKIINKVQGPKLVNKVLVNNTLKFNIPSYDIQLQELKDFIS